MDPTRAAIAAFKAAAAALYGPRLRRVVLFGSHARGEATEDSDIDLVLVLKGPVDAYREIERLGEATWAIDLQYGVLLAVVPISEDDFLHRATPLLLNVRREGVEA